MNVVQRIVARIATARSDQVNVLVVESTGVTWRAPAQITREQLQAATARRLAK
ncbi:hypothetical protein [Kocuria rosea]|uniref:hypothetical protein n=1 Tax=Kocuria rosea TaxID=1275 RepID=UPI00140BCC45|nr:hypothetical protein [Kocuria rosea]